MKIVDIVSNWKDEIDYTTYSGQTSSLSFSFFKSCVKWHTTYFSLVKTTCSNEWVNTFITFRPIVKSGRTNTPYRDVSTFLRDENISIPSLYIKGFLTWSHKVKNQVRDTMLCSETTHDIYIIRVLK